MRPSEIQEEVDTLITEVSHFVNVENLKVLTGLSESHQTFRVEVPTVKQIEVRQLGEVGQEFGEGQIWAAFTDIAALHLVGVSVTVQTTWAWRQSFRERGWFTGLGYLWTPG